MLNTFDGESETPELIWDSGMRGELRSALAEKIGESFEMDHASITSYELHPSFRVRYAKLEEELYLGGVYVRLYLKEPTYNLRDPGTFLKHLLQRWLHEIKLFIPSEAGSNKSPLTENSKLELVTTNQDKLELVTSASVYLCKIREGLCDKLAEWGYINESMQLMYDVLISELTGTPLLSIIRLLHVASNRISNVEIIAAAGSGGGKGGIVDYTMRTIGSEDLHPDCSFIIEMLKKVFIKALGDVEKAALTGKSPQQMTLPTANEQHMQMHVGNVAPQALAPSPAPGPHPVKQSVSIRGPISNHNDMHIPESSLIPQALAPSPAPGLDPVKKTVTTDDPLAAFRTEPASSQLPRGNIPQAIPSQQSQVQPHQVGGLSSYSQQIEDRLQREAKKQVKQQVKKEASNEFKRLTGGWRKAQSSQVTQSQPQMQQSQLSYSQRSQQQYQVQHVPKSEQVQQSAQLKVQQQPHQSTDTSYAQRSQLLNQSAQQQPSVGSGLVQQQQYNAQLGPTQTSGNLSYATQSQVGQPYAHYQSMYPQTHQPQLSAQQNSAMFSAQQHTAGITQSLPIDPQTQHIAAATLQTPTRNQQHGQPITSITQVQPHVVNQPQYSSLTNQQSFQSGNGLPQQRQAAAPPHGSYASNYVANNNYNQQSMMPQHSSLVGIHNQQPQHQVMAQQQYPHQQQMGVQQEYNYAAQIQKTPLQSPVIIGTNSQPQTQQIGLASADHIQPTLPITNSIDQYSVPGSTAALSAHSQTHQPSLGHGDHLQPVQAAAYPHNQAQMSSPAVKQPQTSQQNHAQPVVETVGTHENPIEGSGIDARSSADPKVTAEQQTISVGGAPGAAQGRIALLQSALACNLVEFLLDDVLENETLKSVKDPSSAKVHAVELLKLLTKDPAYGMKFSLILDELPSWRKYKSQDHSLFITGKEQKADYFLTDGSSEPTKLLTEK
mmetsp:Transcript_11529/g.16907  ORF Transcript_11529/g.16907 Transcript_11529/m.16907 type:complete len:945 (-) Transcript_11529:260-3094(-)